LVVSGILYTLCRLCHIAERHEEAVRARVRDLRVYGSAKGWDGVYRALPGE